MEWTDLQKKSLRALKAKKLTRNHLERLQFEFKEIEKQGTEQYWLDKYQAGEKFDHNRPGLVLPFLLDMTEIDPIAAGIEHQITYATDFPDIDLDFLPIARDPVKTYALEKYGGEYVCGIGSWTKYKPKSALQDAARVLGYEPGEITNITKNLPEEFDEMTLEDSLREYPDFLAYAKENRDVVKLAYRMVGLIKNQGRHAAGVIISSVPIRDHIPLTLCPPKPIAEGGYWTSSWTEGSVSELSRLGFIKFDILGLNTLMDIWLCEKLIKEDFNIDISWDMDVEENRAGWIIDKGEQLPIPFDDQAALIEAASMRTDSVFQFYSDLAKSILAKGGVQSFNDLLIYTSLGRPGPLPMIDTYIKRRDGKEDWRSKEHPDVAAVLEPTYGVIVFQEQLAKIWAKFAAFTAPECEKARKAVAKKKTDQLPAIEAKWMKGASRTLGELYAKEMWDKMVTFGRYAFNQCLHKDEIVVNPTTGEQITIDELKSRDDFSLLSYDLDNGEYFIDDVVGVIDAGMQEVFEVEFNNGVIIYCTMDHKFLCEDGLYRTVAEILEGDYEIQSYDC